jgi:hypothetical protein
MDVYRKSIVQRPPPKFFKFLYSVVIEILNLKGSMRLMQKTDLFPLQIGELLANASKIYRIYVQIQYFFRLLVAGRCGFAVI